MKRFFNYLMVLACMAWGLQLEAKPRIMGFVDIDTDHTTSTVENGKKEANRATTLNREEYSSQARALMMVRSNHSWGDWMGTGIVSLMANSNGSVRTQDVFLRLQNTEKFYEFKVGNFLGLPLYKLGYLVRLAQAEEAPSMYLGNFGNDRRNNGVAFGYDGISYTTFQLKLVYGTHRNMNRFGYRPVVYWNYGNYYVRFGHEHIRDRSRDNLTNYLFSRKGTVATFYFKNDSVDTGLSYAISSYKGADAYLYRTVTSGGYFTYRCENKHTLGLGVHSTDLTASLEVEGMGLPELADRSNQQWFVAYGHPLFTQSVSMKYAISESTVSVDDGDNSRENKEFAARVRLNYLF